ncbi:MAG: glycosyltransferase family 39 protein [Chloroflexota bacterium]
MTELAALGNLLPLLAFLVSAGLAVFARFRKWEVAEPQKEPERAEPPQAAREATFRGRVGRFVSQNRWGLILAAALAFILLFAILFAPTRLTGEIPRDPNQPGRPFFSLHWTRTYLRDHAEDIAAATGLVTGLLCLAPIFIAVKRRSRLHAEIALLLASIGLAILAQWTAAKEDIRIAGAWLYVASAFGIFYWTWLARHRLASDLEPAPAPRGAELALIVSLLALTAFARFYALEAVPYGVEGDEAKWTSEAVNLALVGKPDSSAEYHRDALPVSFYLQTPFHRLFGAGQLSARMTVAFLSVLASLVFYWLMRQMAPIPLAALATFLLAVSIFDISASRLANVESFVKIGAVAPLAALAYALTGKPWQAYALAGLALALAALTYDTLWPMIGVCLILFLAEIRKQEIPVREKAKNFAALFLPTALALPVLIPYFASRVNYYQIEKKGWDADAAANLWEHFKNVLAAWFVALRPDFLYNRSGPLVNAALLPWLAVGFAAALVLVRARSARWLLVWTLLVLFPVPILANSPLGRVFYPALPAVYALIALGLFLFWKEIGRVVSAAYRPLLTAVALVPLVWLPLANFYIYFNEVSEPGDRQMRREIGDLIAESAAPDTLILLAVVPGADEPLNNEIQMMDMSLLARLTPEQAKDGYRQVAIEEVLPSITGEYAGWKNLIVVLDKNSPGARAERDALRAGLQSCFPLGRLIEGNYFERYVLDEAARAASECTPVRLNLSVLQSPELYWKLTPGRANFVTLHCAGQVRDYVWLEAERLSLGAGWEIEINFVTDWSGKGFLEDNYGSQIVGYNMESSFDGPELFVWLRTYKRVTDNSPAYLTVNGATYPFAATPEASLNQWIWERLGPFPNTGTILQVAISRPYEEDPGKFMALFIDSLIVTDDASLSPTDQLTAQAPPLGFMLPGGESAGSIIPDLPPGQYTCYLELQSTQPLVDAFGRTPVYSNEVEFRVP